MGVGESYDVKIILPDISEDTAYDPIIVRLVTSHAQLGLRRTTRDDKNGNNEIFQISVDGSM